MTKSELIEVRKNNITSKPYCLHWWQGWNYGTLGNIMTIRKRGRNHVDESYNDCIVFADTETSKSHINAVFDEDGQTKYIPVINYVVAWTITIRAFHHNIVTLYGSKPSDFPKCLNLIFKNMHAGHTIVFMHNMPYDYVFLRKFLYDAYGYPIKELATKPHYPISIEFENGLILRDSYILAQRSLDKWGKDMNISVQKALGKWDYEKIRNQGEQYTPDELEYIEHDTLVGAECIDALMTALNKDILTLPLTATGIPREQCRKLGKPHDAHKAFKKMALTLEEQTNMEKVFHGGFVHANRHLVDEVVSNVRAYDFSSSYPYCMLAFKYPTKFSPVQNCDIDNIVKYKEDYAFFFKLVLIQPVLKDYGYPMPMLQFSKTEACLNPVLDNGRILYAEYVEIYLNEIDLDIFLSQYSFKYAKCVDVEMSKKEYLPRWFTDYVFSLYEDKTRLKGRDDMIVNYNLRKATLNSCYGMCVQKPVKPEINEVYENGNYSIEHPSDDDLKEMYSKFLNNRNSILPFQWGTWVTSYAMHNLFELGACAGTWVYSDTDSCYGCDWDISAVEAYNEKCKSLLKANNYSCVLHNNREYWLGIAELDGEYSEFIAQGAKRYCGRSKKDNELHITVAGVPKKSAFCLNDNIRNFTKGFIFKGEATGKKTHTYIFNKEIYIDSRGNEIGDSIDLTPCDYKLDGVVEQFGWEDLITEEVEIQVYDEGRL